jgi:hypothetical protein
MKLPDRPKQVLDMELRA